MDGTFEDAYWNQLLFYIEKGKCTPFLGAGAAAGILPLGVDVAQEWAQTSNYPLDDPWNLPRVAQYLAVTSKNFLYPKDLLASLFKDVVPDFDSLDQPYTFLAELKLPVYITTNYDNFMVKALELRGAKPVTELCRWKRDLQKQLPPSVFEADYSPKPDCPVVFHLHGYLDEPKSMVLTEDDYIDFLVHISEYFNDVLPSRIQEALTESVLLFLGYGLNDWNFRVLFRALSENLAKSSQASKVSVQLLPQASKLSKEEKATVQSYLDKYYNHLEIEVFWGTCGDFLRELKQRWEARHGNC